MPYDSWRGVHANVGGRVTTEDAVVPGLYVCGWSKRGPSGTIGTNRDEFVVVADGSGGAMQKLRAKGFM